MKTNVSIKFNSIEEYREIEKKLVELGYKPDEYWNKYMLEEYKPCYTTIFINENSFGLYDRVYPELEEVYNSLEEFLKD